MVGMGLQFSRGAMALGDGYSFLNAFAPDLWLSADRSRCGVTGARDFTTANDERFELSPLAPGLSDFWFATWVYLDVSQTNGLVRLYSSGNAGWSIDVLRTDAIRSNLGSGEDFDIISSLNLNTWYHIVLLFERDGVLTGYVNGQSINTTDISSTSSDDINGTSLCTIGSHTSSSYLDGRMCRIAYGEGNLLSTDDIAELYNNGQGKTWDELSSSLQSKCKHYWNGLEASGTLYDQCGSNNGTDNNGVGHAAGPRVEQAADSSGNGYHGTLKNMDTPDCWSSDVPAALGSGYSLLFDGADDEVQTADGDHAFAVSGLDVITATIWVKWSGMEHADNYNGLLSLDGYTFGFGIDGPDKAIRSVLHTSEGYYCAVTGNDVLSADQWLHITLRYDDTGDRKQYIFLDGLEKAVSSPLIGVVSDVSSVPFLFGKGFKSGGYLQGHIAQVCVYHEALSDADIAALAVGNSITPTPVMQYDLNDGPQQGAPANGDPVASLESRDGQRYLFNQDTASRRPTFVESGINSQPVLEFDGSDDYLEIAQAILSGERGTCFAVWECTDTYDVCLSVGSSDSECCDIGQSDNSNARMVHESGGTTNSIEVPAARNTPHVMMFSSDGETYHFRVDGDDETETASGSNDGKLYGDDIAGTPDQTQIGSQVGGSGYEWNGYIAEVIAYDGVVLPTDVRDAIETYLATKYGITLS